VTERERVFQRLAPLFFPSLHLLSISPPSLHLSTFSPSLHLFTSSPLHLFTSLPPHLSTFSPSLHLLSISPPSLHLSTFSPSLHLLSISPPSLHRSTFSPSLHLFISPSLHLSTCFLLGRFLWPLCRSPLALIACPVFWAHDLSVFSYLISVFVSFLAFLHAALALRNRWDLVRFSEPVESLLFGFQFAND
jgi:hypothetical protein